MFETVFSPIAQLASQAWPDVTALQAFAQRRARYFPILAESAAEMSLVAHLVRRLHHAVRAPQQ
eukprot:12057750-Alexandrium_andersonii.AAC.1